MANQILTHAGQTGNPTPGNGQPPTNDNRTTLAWLQAKIDLYQTEVIRLERELVHARASLKGHQLWFAEAQQRGEP
jgi:hypothetical protein